MVDLLAGGQGVFNIVPLAGVLEELEADIVRLDAPAAEPAPNAAAVTQTQRARAAGE